MIIEISVLVAVSLFLAVAIPFTVNNIVERILK